MTLRKCKKCGKEMYLAFGYYHCEDCNEVGFIRDENGE